LSPSDTDLALSSGRRAGFMLAAASFFGAHGIHLPNGMKRGVSEATAARR